MKDRTAYIISFVLHASLLLFLVGSKSASFRIPLQMPGPTIQIDLAGFPPAQPAKQLAQNKTTSSAKKEEPKKVDPPKEEPKKEEPEPPKPEPPKPEPPKEEKPKEEPPKVEEKKKEEPPPKKEPDPKVSEEIIKKLQEKLAAPTPTPKAKKQATPKPTVTPKTGKDSKGVKGDKPTPTPTPAKNSADQADAGPEVADASGIFPRIPLSGIGQGFSKGTEKGAPGQIGGTSSEFFIMGDPNAPYDFANYGAILANQLRRAWRPPTVMRPQNQEYVTVVSFIVSKDGVISNVKMEQQSGWPVMDDSVLKALEDVQTVEPLPFNYTADYIQVTAPFVNPIGTTP